MNMMEGFNKTINYIDEVLDKEIDEKEVVRLFSYSYPIFSRLFSILTSYTLNEYIRYRKLFKANLEIKNTNNKIIDIALKYGYES